MAATNSKIGDHEDWKSIEGYAGLYEVSTFGRVRSLDRVVEDTRGIHRQLIGGVLEGSLSTRNRYTLVGLHSEGEVKTFSVHRLVAQAFLPNPTDLLQVNHIDEVKSNNCVDNLEWCTAQYNQEYSTAKGYKFISPEGREVSVWNLRRFCRFHGLDPGHMCKVFLGKSSHHKNWRRFHGEE